MEKIIQVELNEVKIDVAQPISKDLMVLTELQLASVGGGIGETAI